MKLYYYTSTDTMRYILGSGDIYATNIRYMNDSEEYTNGLNEIKLLMLDKKMVQAWITKRGRNDVKISDMKRYLQIRISKRIGKIESFIPYHFARKTIY